MKKQRNHPIYMRFAQIAGKSAGAGLDVVFPFTSTGMSELRACPGSCHPQFLTKSHQQGPSSWQLGGGSLQVWESFPASIPNSTARPQQGFGKQRVSGQL